MPFSEKIRWCEFISVSESFREERGKRMDDDMPMAFNEDRLCGVEVSGDSAVRTSTLLHVLTAAVTVCSHMRHCSQHHSLPLPLPFLSHRLALSLSPCDGGWAASVVGSWVAVFRRQCVCCSRTCRSYSSSISSSLHRLHTKRKKKLNWVSCCFLYKHHQHLH